MVVEFSSAAAMLEATDLWEHLLLLAPKRGVLLTDSLVTLHAIEKGRPSVPGLNLKLRKLMAMAALRITGYIVPCTRAPKRLRPNLPSLGWRPPGP